jgi:hypothetical protein
MIELLVYPSTKLWHQFDDLLDVHQLNDVTHAALI